MAFVGMHSYSIYLWHGASGWLRTATERLAGGTLNWLLDVALYFVVSIFMGIGASKAVEWPVVKLRDRWLPSRSKPPTIVSESAWSLTR
jgi:peptidoglycan/LPS O-acetylase OafA/YrhL